MTRDASVGPPETPVEVWQRTWEVREAVEEYRARVPMRVLEIGSKRGGTMWHWLRNATPGALLVSIEPFYDNEAAYTQWAPPGVTVEQWRGFSAALVDRAREAGPWDWVFLDADHMEDAVRADWAAYSPLVAPGGVFAFHDIVTGPDADALGIHVEPVWREVQRAGHLTREIVADPAEEWGGIGLVYL